MSLNIAFVGALSIHKGSRILYNLLINRSLPVKWFICGYIDDNKFDWCKLADVYGSYRHADEMIDYLDYNGVDIVIMPSACAESFSYTLSEVWKGGYPVLAINRGAIGERINKLNGGWTCNEDELCDFIKLLHDNEWMIYESIDSVNKIVLKSCNDMLNDYLDIYNNVILS